MTSKIRVLILGGGGFVGPYLKKEFLDSGYEVKTADINGADVRRDITNYDDIASILENFKPDIISNLAGISFVPDNQDNNLAFEVNTLGSLKLLDAVWHLRENNILKKDVLIHLASSSEVYGNDCFYPDEEKSLLKPLSDYGWSKLFMEEFAKTFQKLGLRIIITRAFNHTGIGQSEKFIIPSFCKQVIEIKKGIRPAILYHGDISTERDITDVRDMAKAYLLIIELGETGIYNIGSGKKYSGFKILELIRKCSGVEFEDRIDPQRSRPSSVECTLCNIIPFMRKTGWRPIYSLEDTINEFFKNS